MNFNANLFSLLPLIMHGIQTAESMKGAKGSEKKAKALELVRVGLNGLAVAGKHPLDEPSTLEAVDKGIDAAVAAVNAIQKPKQAA